MNVKEALNTLYKAYNDIAADDTCFNDLQEAIATAIGHLDGAIGQKPGDEPDLDKVCCEIARAMGVIATLYALTRDCIIDYTDAKDGKLDDVVSDTINGLSMALIDVQQARKERLGRE